MTIHQQAEELNLNMPISTTPPMSLTTAAETAKQKDALAVAVVEHKLTALQKEQAQKLAQEIDASNPQFVVNFGSTAQNQMAEMVRQSATSTLAESGAAGKLLLLVKQHTEEITRDDVEAVNPSGMPKNLRQLATRVVNNLPFIGKNLQQRIDEFSLKKETVGSTLISITNDLQVESNVSMVLVEQLGELSERNKTYYEDLKVIKTALAIAIEREKVNFQNLRDDVKESTDQYNLTVLTEKNSEVERLERRLDAIDKSLALAILHRAQISKVKEILIYNAEALQEAHSVMIPMWNMNIELILTLLKTDDQQRIIQELRTASDQLGMQAVELIKKLDDAQWSMKQRTFIAAEVVAKGYDAMRQGIDSHISRIDEVRLKREEGQKLMTDAQISLAKSIRNLADNLLEEPQALNTQMVEEKPLVKDAAALLLRTPASTVIN